VERLTFLKTSALKERGADIRISLTQTRRKTSRRKIKNEEAGASDHFVGIGTVSGSRFPNLSLEVQPYEKLNPSAFLNA
jgi:hypothetical protein